MGNPNNRANEYDVLSDAYSRMLIDELIPEVAKKYKISDNPDLRVIGGTSSGATGAWTVAWERPDQFRKSDQHDRQLHFDWLSSRARQPAHDARR